MGILSALFGKQVTTIEEAFKAKDSTSAAMCRAIGEWFRLYFDARPTEDEDPCQRLPFVVVNKLVKTVFSEYTASISGPDGFLESLLGELDGIRKKAMQMALVGGECYIRPVVAGGKLTYSVVRRDNCLIFARDSEGKPVDMGLTENSTRGGRYYTLLERRTLGQDGRLRIQLVLYQSADKSILGTVVPLETLPQYAGMAPDILLPLPMDGLGMAVLRTPMVNCVDGSEDAVSVYAPAVGLIRNINRNEAQLGDEFDNGASRIIASADLMVRGPDGSRKLTDKQFVGIDDDPEAVGITIFSPALREQSYLARKQEYLRNIESIIGLKRGILSEVEAAERTATEITSSEGDYNLTVIDFQGAWETAAREALRVGCLLGQMYRLSGARAFAPEDLVIDWGDGVLYNRDRTWTEYKEMVAAGMLKPELALAWYFNLPHEKPDDLQKVREQYMPEMENLLGGEE